MHFNAKRAFDLVTYASIVLTLARDIKGSAWAKYDRLFHQAAAVNPQLLWHRREQDIWMMSATESASLLSQLGPHHSRVYPQHYNPRRCAESGTGGPAPLPSAVTGTCASHAGSRGTSPGTAHLSMHPPRPRALESDVQSFWRQALQSQP